MSRQVFFVGLAVLLFAPNLSPQQPGGWQDPSQHTVQFVTVDADVKLEVLDWGGAGRPLVLLAGLGNTAHVFDDFAPKLTGSFHVYAITRRGFGASSSPAAHDNNYSADRLGDDVLAVLDALKLDRPILVGHSIAGEELSSIGSRHPERVAGLVYLDAGYAYAYYNNSLGDFSFDLGEVRTTLEQFKVGMSPDDEKRGLSELQEELPRFENDVTNMRKTLDVANPQSPNPSPADLASVAAFQSWRKANFGYAVPEAEIRVQFEITPSGGLGKHVDEQVATLAIIRGEQKFTDIRAPILAIYVVGHRLGPYADKDPVARDAALARAEANDEAIADGFQKGLPSARVIRIRDTYHYIFITNETDVLREIRALLSALR
ncbi:MAG TPA: alpha/beta hydrolase [Candidatus Acidoferrales bacterium]|nr:alpha/beta hydrolase [Candidatus Acidoferrales bacterium]